MKKTESKRVAVDLDAPKRETVPAPAEDTKPSAPPRAFTDFSQDEQAELLKRYVAGGHEDLPMLAPAALKGIVREYLIAKGHRDVPMVL